MIMTRHVFIFCSILVGFSTWAQTNKPKLPPTQVADYSLAFADEFDALDLSPNGSGAHSWYESVWWDAYLPDRSLLSTSNSVLSLSWDHSQRSSNTSIATFAHDKSQGRTWR